MVDARHEAGETARTVPVRADPLEMVVFDAEGTVDALVTIQERAMVVTEQIRVLVGERDAAHRIAGELADALEGANTDDLSVERSARLGRAWLAVPQE